ncbi:MAG: VWA domain-containing protein, partial [Deltaproteobacteria bacterium]|nr:VWA domain-containing protein [Deltaproteobacteria bacterium]
MKEMTMMQFAQPQWLWIGAIACVGLVALFVRAARKRRKALAQFASASPETSVDRRRRLARGALATLGVAMASIAMARPLAGFRWEQQPHQGVDLMFAVDTSKSMLAADLRPDRLTRAKLAVADLVRKFDGERLGLIAFAGNAFVQAPMTVDRGVFLEALDALDTEIIPRGGSDLASAIRAAAQAMSSEPGHRKVLVLLSDGEDLAGNATEAAREAAGRGLTIYTVGVGSRQGQLIEIAGQSGALELVRDENGEPVRSRLDESTLRGLAQLTGGSYQPLGADGRGLDALYAQAKAQLPLSTAMGTARKVYTERFQIPLAIALGCLLLELALGDRRRRARSVPSAALAATLGLFLFGMPRLASAESSKSSATSSYNSGTETYRKGDFDAAEKQFEAALRTDDVRLQVDTYYDLGNARYRLGQGTLASKDREATIATWKRALEAYDAALALAPGDEDATFNREFVANKLAALEEEKKRDEQEKKQQDQPGQGQQPQNKSGQGQQPKDQQGQGQQQPNQSGQGQQPKDQQGQGQQPKDQQGQG